MARLSFETDGEKKMYDRGRRDAVEELMKAWYEQLREQGAFPDKSPEAFAQWGQDVLLPEMRKYRGQDDLFNQLINA
jgi:hypothetical protein